MHRLARPRSGLHAEIDAAPGLDELATGHKLDLDTQGCARAAFLAARVRREMLTPGIMKYGYARVSSTDLNTALPASLP